MGHARVLRATDRDRRDPANAPLPLVAEPVASRSAWHAVSAPQSVQRRIWLECRWHRRRTHLLPIRPPPVCYQPGEQL